ncbi:MAG: hypothetical protein JSR56_09280 [Proteobacteria bacterium]|nr:hypothetical protein [Pseudomonadota bacterium]
MQVRHSQPGPLPWYRTPIAWLGVLIFVASLAGCVWIIVASVQHRDEALPVSTHSVLGVPAHSPPVPASS